MHLDAHGDLDQTLQQIVGVSCMLTHTLMKKNLCNTCVLLVQPLLLDVMLDERRLNVFALRALQLLHCDGTELLHIEQQHIATCCLRLALLPSFHAPTNCSASKMRLACLLPLVF